MSEDDNKKRGRRLGFKLSEKSKKQISKSKTGQYHTQETKDKISHTLLAYFRQKNPLSEEIINNYCRSDDDDLCGWVTEVQDKLDKLDDVKTERILRNNGKIELSFGNNIEFFGHDVTPESIMLFKEYCKINKLDIEDIEDLL